MPTDQETNNDQNTYIHNTQITFEKRKIKRKTVAQRPDKDKSISDHSYADHTSNQSSGEYLLHKGK